MIPVLIRNGTLEIAIEGDQNIQVIPIDRQHAEIMIVEAKGGIVPIKGRFSSVTVRYKEIPHVPVQAREDQ